MINYSKNSFSGIKCTGVLVHLGIRLDIDKGNSGGGGVSHIVSQVHRALVFNTKTKRGQSNNCDRTDIGN